MPDRSPLAAFPDSPPARPAVLGPALALLVALAVVALIVGPASATDVTFETLAWIRAPRVVAAILVGAALAASGASLQVAFRNPLAAPDLLGVSAGAACGAAFAILAGFGQAALQGSAFAGALAASGLVWALARWIRIGDATLALVLSGIGVAALASAVLALVSYLADPARQLPAITYWLLGSLAAGSATELIVAGVAMALGLTILWFARWRINLLALPDEEVRALGADPVRLRWVALAGAALAAAAAVALAGVVGWVGLLVPHAARRITGAEFSRLLPLAALTGAIFLLAVDTLGRVAFPIDLPPGVSSALFGVPGLLWLLASRPREPGR